MNKTHISTIGVVLIFIMCSTFVAVPFDDDVYTSAEESDYADDVADYTVYRNSSLKIINQSEMELYNQKSKYNLNEAIFVESVIPHTPTKDIILIDSMWINNNKSSTESNISDLIKSGHPIILLGDDSSSLKAKGVGTAFLAGGSVYGIYYDQNMDSVSCYSVIDCALESSISYAYNWAVDAVENSNFEKTRATALDANSMKTYDLSSQPAKAGGSLPLGQRVQSNADATCGSFGSVHIRTSYTEILSANPSKSYYLVEYSIQSVSSGGSKRTTGLRVMNDVDKYLTEANLQDYGPTTSSGTTTVSLSGTVGAGWSAGGGPSVSGSFTWGWSYSTPDVIVIDNSNFGTDTLNIFHQIAADKNAAKNTYLAKPGAIFDGKKDSNGSYYYGVDIYTAEFRTQQLFGYSGVSAYDLVCYVSVFSG